MSDENRRKIPMIKKSVRKLIDETIKTIWIKNIPRDFDEGYIINEDCLKISFCYHLRRKAVKFMNELSCIIIPVYPKFLSLKDLYTIIETHYGTEMWIIRN